MGPTRTVGAMGDDGPVTPPAPAAPSLPRASWGPDAATAASLVVTTAAIWLVAKMVSTWAWVLLTGEYGDTYYYLTTAEEVSRAGGGVAEAFREYPTPAGLLLMLPYELGATHHDQYRAAILVMTSLADAAFALLLGRRTGPLGVLAWVLLTSSLGQLALLRFDMLPAAVAGAAVLLAMENRRVAASVLVGLGTGLKIWPIVLAPLAHRRGGWRAPLVALAATGAALVVGSLAAGGWTRLLSPLGYQRDRGLQIEAVAATIPMHAWADDPAYRVWFSTFVAYEVVGTSVPTWLAVAQAASVVGALACVTLVGWWFWRGSDPAAIAWLALVLVGTFVVTSRALSPQYLLWLAAPTAVLVALALRGGKQAPPLAPALLTFAAVLVLCGLTLAIYPVHYDGLVNRGELTERALAFLTARNLGLLALVAWSAACAIVVTNQGHSRQQLSEDGVRG